MQCRWATTHQHEVGERALLLAASWCEAVLLHCSVGGAESLSILDVGVWHSQATRSAGCTAEVKANMAHD